MKVGNGGSRGGGKIQSLYFGNDAASSLGLPVEKVWQCVGVTVKPVTRGWSREEKGEQGEGEEKGGKGSGGERSSTRARG